MTQRARACVTPWLVKEWHQTRNGDLTPQKVTRGSSKRVWWQCAVASDHEWQATVVSRASWGGGCPFCNGKRSRSTNCLSIMHPKIAAEWHPDKYGLLKPDALTWRSSKKVRWRCSRNSGYEWQSTGNDRTSRKSRCPVCSQYLSRGENGSLFLLSWKHSIEPSLWCYRKLVRAHTLVIGWPPSSYVNLTTI